MKHWLRNNWRVLLSRLPLPMLALAAAYGVYSYASLFVPGWVAFIQAAAFETTYIGLAVADVPEKARRQRALWISVSAVAVSVIYNSLAGFFHRYPSGLIGLSWSEEALLAVTHGAPLAIVAYLVADLLLHTTHKKAQVFQRMKQLRATIRKLVRNLRQLRTTLEQAHAMHTQRERELLAKIAGLEQELRNTQEKNAVDMLPLLQLMNDYNVPVAKMSSVTQIPGSTIRYRLNGHAQEAARG